MEDFRVDVVVGKGPGATAIPLDVEPFTLVGATTRAGPADRAAAGPVRVRRPPGLLRAGRPGAGDAPLGRASWACRSTDDGAAEIAGRSRGTPRIANRLLRRVRDYAEVRADGVVTRATAQAALTVYDVDHLGLDRLDRAVLSRWSASSAAARSGSPRSRWPSARSRTPSRRSASRSWSAPGCWPVPRAAGWPPPAAGGTSGRTPPTGRLRHGRPFPDLLIRPTQRHARDPNVSRAAVGAGGTDRLDSPPVRTGRDCCRPPAARPPGGGPRKVK